MAGRLTLTFDNGPTPGVTEGVLDVLGERGIAATFFAVGSKAREPGCRKILERVVDEGHWVGNHTYHHGEPLGQHVALDAERVEIGAAQEVLGDFTRPERLFRPAGSKGLLDERLLRAETVHYLKSGRYSLVLWNSIPRDWSDPEGWVETCLAQIEQVDWAVVVLHDLPTGAMERLPEFIRRADAEGLEFRQDFPAECVPIWRGRVQGDLDGLVTRMN